MKSNQIGFHGVLTNNDLLELLNMIYDSRTRLKAVQGYVDELKQGSNEDISSKVQEYTPIIKVLDNDIDKTLDTTIYYLNNLKP
ncbi:hypothetical protein D1B17_03745 [Companilactobacillus zhachilii]|uniref:Uncharacterized protein n=1 Tax=Companilactobacillus zhachilii TaxID=2304606 RepID=A0A386PPU3_9LACO|nr:hypothetical protein [Companilactobacillus zhachilii]AYE37791.1 hypothetical protein D1B17_03745 [Companilactobacillus zhachilii]